AGVTTKNWSKTFTRHWVAMKHIFHRLDSEALLFVMRTRSKKRRHFQSKVLQK
ncbi:antiterminator, partial [Shigella flexneri]|nr:antiterminator [Shigella flexneri]